MAAAAGFAASASAQIQPTPAGWEPEQAKAKADAYIASQIAVFTRKAPADEVKLALQLAQMVRPDEPTVTNQLAFYIGAGKPDQAYQDILAFRPDEPIATYYLAEKLSEEGYVNLALPFYAKAASQRPDDAVVQYKAGMNAFFAEDDAACIAYFTRSLAIGGDSIPVWLKRGECYARAGKKKEAETDFNRAEGNSGAYSVRMFREGVFNGCGWGWGSLDDRVRDAAKTADDWKNYEGYRELTRVLECDPKHVGALRERLKLEDRDTNLKQHAQVHRIQLQNLQDGGQTNARRLAALQPPTAAQMLAEGRAIDMTNDSGGAKRMRAAYLASRVLMQEPDNAQAHLLRARALANLGIGPLSALAWDEATKALAADPKLATAHFVRAILYARGNGFSEAATELTAAIAIDPNDMRFYAQRGDAYARLGRNEPAVKDLTHFLASDPKNIPALKGRAQANFHLKKYEAALADLNAAYAIDAKDFRLKVSIVEVLDAMGRSDDADNMHLMMLAESPAEAKVDTVLKARTTPALLAKSDLVKQGLQIAALEKRAKDRFQSFVNDYSPAEYAFDNLVSDMNSVDAARDGQKKIDDLRSTAKYVDEHLASALRTGTALIDSDDIEGLPLDLLGKLTAWMLHVEQMQTSMKQINAALY